MAQSSAITNLGNQKPEQFHRDVARGIDHLVSNIRRLDAVAQRASNDGDEATASLLGNFADEEAAKVLILLDAVRCPQSDQRARARTLKRWNSHLWKGIYTRACHLRPANLSDVASYVEYEMQPFYLDGPRDVDWIFRNEINSERERKIYVDLVADFTKTGKDGHEPYWTTPQDFTFSFGGYRSSNCVEVALALHAHGIASERGLKHVAAIWHPIDPETINLPGLLAYVNETLSAVRLDSEAETAEETDLPSPSPLANWPFPLWSVAEPAKIKQSEFELLDALREDRDAELRRIRQLQGMKEPPPEVSRDKVLEMDAAFARVEDEWNKRIAAHPSPHSRLPILSRDVDLDVSETEAWLSLRCRWRGLSEGERVSLVALAWFSRGPIADWPRAVRLAQEKTDIHSAQAEHYYLGLGGEWLKGLDRWELPADHERMSGGWR